MAGGPVAFATPDEGHPARQRAATSAASVRIVTRESDFAALREPWNALARSRPDLSVFARHEWFEAAWQWRRESADLFVLVHEEGGRVRAVLPLCRRGPAGRRRELAFITVPDTQACDMIVSRDDARACARTFADALAAARGGWDTFRLALLPPGATALELLDALSERGHSVRIVPGPGNPYVALDRTWQAYYDARSRRLKKANNLAANRLRKAGTLALERLLPGEGDAARAQAMLDEVVAVSAASWKAETQTTLDRPGPGRFIRTLSRSAHEQGWLALWVLRLDGVASACEYQLVYDGNVHALRSDFRSGREELSPGSHLNRELLEHAFGRGWQRYWMGPGNNAYKFRWAEATLPLQYATVYARTARGRLHALWELGVRPWARAMRARLRTEPRAGATVPDE